MRIARHSPSLRSAVLRRLRGRPRLQSAARRPRSAAIRPAPLAGQTASANDRSAARTRFVHDKDIPGEWWTLFHSPPLNALIEQCAEGQSRPDRGAGGAAPGAGECRCATRRLLSRASTAGLSAEPQPDPGRRAVAGLGLRQSVLQPDHAAVERVLRAGRVRRQSPHRGIARSAGREPAVPARGHLPDADLERRRRGGAGSLVARPDRRHPGDRSRIETDLLAILRRQLDLGQVAGSRRRGAGSGAGAGAAGAAAAAEAVGAAARPADRAGRPLSEPGSRRDISIWPGCNCRWICRSACPAKLVEQRPDVRAAEASMHSASAQIGVAVAARLPQITLTANVGNSASTAGELFTPGTNFWTLRRRPDRADLRWRHAAAQAARRPGGVRPGGGAIPKHGADRVPERRRCAACAAIRRRCAEGRGRRRNARRRAAWTSCGGSLNSGRSPTWRCSTRRTPISRLAWRWCRPRRTGWPTPRRCSRRWAADGGTAPTSPTAGNQVAADGQR